MTTQLKAANLLKYDVFTMLVSHTPLRDNSINLSRSLSLRFSVCVASSRLKSALVISRVQAMRHNPANPDLWQ